MVLVVLGFVVLTAYAVIASYAPLVAAGGARAAGAFFALLFFCLLVRERPWLTPALALCWQGTFACSLLPPSVVLVHRCWLMRHASAG